MPHFVSPLDSIAHTFNTSPALATLTLANDTPAPHLIFKSHFVFTSYGKAFGSFGFAGCVVTGFINNALSGKKLPVYGDGKNVRDWLYVEDHCKAIDMILENGRIGEVYNIGGHNEKTNIDVVKTVLRILGKDESLITYVKDRPGHDMRYAIDPTKMKNELGWYPETSFDEGIEKTVEWYLSHKQWWENIRNGEYVKYYEKMYGNR